MLALDDLPDLLPHAPFVLVAIVIVFWLYMKVRIVREMLELRGADDPPPKVPGWQLRLAGWAPVTGILFGLFVALVAALVVFGVTE